jgi:hypothetical protein
MTDETRVEETPPSAETVGFVCDKCGKTFKSKARLVRHQLLHPKTEDAPAKRQRKPRVRAQRKSLAPWIATALQPASMVVAQVNPPTGLALSVSAASIGKGFDRLVQGTSIDKTLQPLINKGEVWGDLLWGIAFPALVFAITQQPALAENEGVKQALSSALDHILVASLELRAEAGPTVSERMAKLTEKLGISDEDILAMKQSIIDQIFGQTQQPSPNGQTRHEPSTQAASVE